MDINEASKVVESFLNAHFGDAAVRPLTLQVHPSGDDKDEIKIWMNFGEMAKDLDTDDIADTAIAALRAAHGDIAAAFRFHVRATIAP